MSRKNTYKKFVHTTTGQTVVGVFDKKTDELIQWLPKQGNAMKGRKVLPANGEVIDLLSADTIPYPKHESEFEIQSHIFQHLRSLSYDVRGGVTSKRRLSRFDLVVFVAGRARLIIEVKRRDQYATATQLEKYAAYQIPVVTVRGMEEADQLLRSIVGVPNKYSESLAQVNWLPCSKRIEE